MIAATRTASYTSARQDVVAMVPGSAQRILELGCSNGSTAALLRQKQICDYIGIEGDPELANEARATIDKVFIADLNDHSWLAHIEGSFDCIVAADVLEHLIDPWSTLKNATGVLRDGGTVVLSLPNARHIQTVLNLARGRWPYRDRGVHDATHLRFFTLRGIRALCGVAGLRIDRLTRNRRILDRGSLWDRAARVAALVGLDDFVTYQYVLRGSRNVQPEAIAAESVPPWVRQSIDG